MDNFEYKKYLAEGKLLKENASGKVTRNMWNRMSDDEKIDALQTVFEDPDDAMKHYEKEWNNLPSVATQNMHTEGRLFEEDFKNPILDKYLELKKSIDNKTVFDYELSDFINDLDNTERKGLESDLGLERGELYEFR